MLRRDGEERWTEPIATPGRDGEERCGLLPERRDGEEICACRVRRQERWGEEARRDTEVKESRFFWSGKESRWTVQIRENGRSGFYMEARVP